MKDKILDWLANGQVGLSSKCMAMCAAGVSYKYKYTPSDPSDFNRCLLLVQQIPEVENEFNRIARVSDKWKVVIDNWQLLKSTFIDEVGFNWSNGDRAPKTYKLMKKLGL